MEFSLVRGAIGLRQRTIPLADDKQQLTHAGNLQLQRITCVLRCPFRREGDGAITVRSRALEKAGNDEGPARLVTHTSCGCKSKKSTCVGVSKATESVASIKAMRVIERKEEYFLAPAAWPCARGKVVAILHGDENGRW